MVVANGLMRLPLRNARLAVEVLRWRRRDQGLPVCAVQLAALERPDLVPSARTVTELAPEVGLQDGDVVTACDDDVDAAVRGGAI